MSSARTEDRSSSSGSQPQSFISQPSEDVEPLDEDSRLQSFENYPLPHNVNVIHLARHGFAYRPVRNTRHVSCMGCQKVVEHWEVGDQPFLQQFHEVGCQFVRDRAPSEHSGSITDVTESSFRASVASNEEYTKPLETASTSAARFNLDPARRQETAEMHQYLTTKNLPPARHAFSLPPERTEVSVTRLLKTSGKRGETVSQIHSISHQESGPECYQPGSFPPRRSSARTLSAYSGSQPGSFSGLSSISNSQQSMSLPPSLASQPHPEYQRYQSRLENPDELTHLLESLDLRKAENRLYTFENFWSEENEFINYRLLVVCGFFCFGQGDAVRCFCCHVEIANWSRNDNPRFRHIQMSPVCRFMRGEECGDTPLPVELRRPSPVRHPTMRSISQQPSLHHHTSYRSPQSLPSSPQHSLGPIAQPSMEGTAAALPAMYTRPTPAMYQRSNLMIEFPCRNAADEAMREERVRLRTFSNPQFRRNTTLRASDETLAQAGLYYTGVGDNTKCWCCGGGLNQFGPDDDPWVEHAKFFPECEYLLQQRGPAWVTSISIQNRNIQRPVLATIEGAGLPMVVSSPTPLPPAPARIDDPRQMLLMREQMLEDGMQSEPVQVARGMGYSDEAIKDLQMQKIINDGCCYQTTEPLLRALGHPFDVPDSPVPETPEMLQDPPDMPQYLPAMPQTAPTAPQSPSVMPQTAPPAPQPASPVSQHPHAIPQIPRMPRNHRAMPQPPAGFTPMPEQTIRLPGRTIHIHGGNFIGENVFPAPQEPGSPDDGMQYSTTITSGPDIMINGQSMDQIMHNAFDHPFFRGEMDHLMNAGTTGTTVVNSYQQPRARRRLVTRSTNVVPTIPAPAPPRRTPTPRTSASTTSSSSSVPSTTTSSNEPTATSTSGASSSTTAATGNAQERLDALERERSCKICLNSPADILFQPCGHICACRDCAQRVTSCPVCRSRIVNYIRTYHA